jgi:hypothetical protein
MPLDVISGVISHRGYLPRPCGLFVRIWMLVSGFRTPDIEVGIQVLLMG